MCAKPNHHSWAQIAATNAAPKLDHSLNMWPALPRKQDTNAKDQRHPEARDHRIGEVNARNHPMEGKGIWELTADLMAMEASISDPNLGNLQRSNIKSWMPAITREIDRLQAIQNRQMRREEVASFSLPKNSTQSYTSESIQQITKFDPIARIERWVREAGGEEGYVHAGHAEHLGRQQMPYWWFGYRYLGR